MVDLCLEAIQTTGPVSLFIGIESANWTSQQFTDAGNFAKQHGITCIFLKVFEVGSPAGGAGGFWYGGLSGVDGRISLIKAAGVNVIPYGFLYGDEYGNLATEIDVAKQLLSKYGLLCLDMEGSPWATPNAAQWAKQIVAALEPIPGELWVSCPANPVESGQLPFLQAMVPATNVFMPMVYSDYLATKWEGDFKQVGATCVQPTIDLSGEFGPNNVPAIVEQIIASGAKALSVWEYQFVQKYAAAFDAAVALLTGNQQGGNRNVQLNSQGCVCDVMEWFQLEPNESQDLCGPGAVGELKYAGLPGKGATGTAEQIDQDVDKEADAWLAGGHTGALGSSIENMHQFLHDAGNLHYWDMTNPSVDNIRRAVKAGYPVLITVYEPSLVEKRTGQFPYTWHLDANHILPVIGIDKDGDFICADELNNKFQGYWPVVYKAASMQISWASTVQLVGPDVHNPWLKPVPSGDPSTWTQGFDAQNFSTSGSPTGESTMEQQFDTVWFCSPYVAPGYKSGIYRDLLAAFLNGKISACFATSSEIDAFMWDGKTPIKFQTLSNGLHAEWNDGKTRVYDATNREIV